MSADLYIVAYSLIFLASFSLSLFLFIVSRRALLESKKARFAEIYGKIEGAVLKAVSLKDPEYSARVARAHAAHPRVLTQVLLDYGDLITGGGRDQLKIIFRQAVQERCLKSLRSLRTAKRLQNARLFVIFFDPDESAALFRLLEDKPIVKLAVINALSRFPSPETCRHVFSAFTEAESSRIGSYFNILFSLGHRIEPFVREHLTESLPTEKLGLLVELVGAIPLLPLYEAICRLSTHPDKEIRVKVARALGKLRIPETAKTLIALSEDSAWEVKAQALKSLGKLKSPDALQILYRSLFSPFWYVRFNAGYGLAEMGEDGLRRLRAVAAQNDDKYARDMSLMVLNDLIISEAAA
jgi:hypothetical protein